MASGRPPASARRKNEAPLNSSNVSESCGCTSSFATRTASREQGPFRGAESSHTQASSACREVHTEGEKGCEAEGDDDTIVTGKVFARIDAADDGRGGGAEGEGVLGSGGGVALEVTEGTTGREGDGAAVTVGDVDTDDDCEDRDAYSREAGRVRGVASKATPRIVKSTSCGVEVAVATRGNSAASDNAGGASGLERGTENKNGAGTGEAESESDTRNEASAKAA